MICQGRVGEREFRSCGIAAVVTFFASVGTWQRNRIITAGTVHAADHGIFVLRSLRVHIAHVRTRFRESERLGVDPLRTGGLEVFHEIPRLLLARSGGEVRARTKVVVELLVDFVEHRGLAVLVHDGDETAQDRAGGGVGEFAPVDTGLGMERRIVIVVVGSKEVACVRGTSKGGRQRVDVLVVHEHAVQRVVEHDRVAREVGMRLVGRVAVRDVPFVAGMRIGGVIQRNGIVPWLSTGRDHVVVRLGAGGAEVFVGTPEHRVPVWHDARVDVLHAGRLQVLHLVGVRVGERRHRRTEQHSRDSKRTTASRCTLLPHLYNFIHFISPLHCLTKLYQRFSLSPRVIENFRG